MLKNKPVLLFLLKAFLIFSVLSLPFSFYDSLYGKFYCGVCKMFFGNFQETGIARFTITKPPTNMHIIIGNAAQKRADGMTDAAESDTNFRYRGFIPTILFLSLVLASPISRKRRFYSALSGFILVTIFIMLKQWIHIMYMCQQKLSLNLYVFSPDVSKKIVKLFFGFANYNGSTLVFVFAIWFLVTFRRGDLQAILIKK